MKDAAISAAAALIAGLGDLLSAQVPPLLKVRPPSLLDAGLWGFSLNLGDGRRLK